MDRRQARLENQKLYQQQYRTRRKREKAPGRDDVARALLHYAITENLEHGRHQELAQLIRSISDRLEDQGFDRAATRRTWRSLVVRYGNGWSFQRKVHLRSGGDPEDEAAGQ